MRMQNPIPLFNYSSNMIVCVPGVEPEPFLLGEHLVEASGKLLLIDRLLKHTRSTGHKVLLFSQMTHMLDIIQDYLGYRGTLPKYPHSISCRKHTGRIFGKYEDIFDYSKILLIKV